MTKIIKLPTRINDTFINQTNDEANLLDLKLELESILLAIEQKIIVCQKS